MLKFSINRPILVRFALSPSSNNRWLCCVHPRYEIESLHQLTEDWLVQRVNKDTVAEILALAWKPGSEKLIKACARCLRKCSINEMRGAEGWKAIFGAHADFIADLVGNVAKDVGPS